MAATEKGRAAIVLLSGGLDSAVCAFWAKRRFDTVYAITFDYHKRLERERLASVKIAEAAGIKQLFHIDLPFLREVSDLDSDVESSKLKMESDSRLGSYVPARNMIFYSITAHYAEYLGADTIIGGHNSHDSSFFKDSSALYFEMINELFKQGCLLCTDRPYRVLLPLAAMDRRMIIKLAVELQVPMDLTWSCHIGEKTPCGACYACVQRAEAFSQLHLKDPCLRTV